jgi:hypothetical protein
VAAATLIALLTVGVGVSLTFERAAAARAALEADRAGEATELLAQLFDASDPGQTRGRRISAPEVLEWGERRVEALGRAASWAPASQHWAGWRKPGRCWWPATTRCASRSAAFWRQLIGYAATRCRGG